MILVLVAVARSIRSAVADNKFLIHTKTPIGADRGFLLFSSILCVFLLFFFIES